MMMVRRVHWVIRDKKVMWKDFRGIREKKEIGEIKDPEEKTGNLVYQEARVNGEKKGKKV